MGSKRREVLLNCAKDKSLFCQFIKTVQDDFSANFGEFKGTNGKKLLLFISEILQELSQKQLQGLWENLSELVLSSLKGFSAILLDHQQQDEMMEANDTESIPVLEGVCILLLSSVRLEEPTITESMVKTATLLHGSLFDVHEVNSSLAACICALCEEWWKKKLSSHENLCLGTITYLLKLFLNHEKSGKLTNICQMQNCLSLFNFSRVSNAAEEDIVPSEELYIHTLTMQLRQHLLDCFDHFVILKEKNGRKFLSSVMLLDKDIMKEAHQVVINSLTHTCPITKAEALGSIYFQAWRIAEQEMKDVFEEVCIQDIMYRAVHAPRMKNNNLFLPLHRMTLSIVCHKGSVEVRHMITRLYNPIIWRSLKAINAMVRANASSLLLDAFPLEEEDSQKPRLAENEEFMQRQFDALNDMFLDVCPRIRVIGILGLCDILHTYWDAIPAHVIAILTRKLYNDLAFDAAMDVRHAVFKGTIMLLDTPCAHPLLGKLLPPCIEKCMHDVSEKVRIAVADVLLAVKQTSSISFWNVCPLANLLAQLEIDNIAVSKRLVRLLLRSFLPEDHSQQVWVERCASFYKRNVNAARKFYMLVDKELTVQETGEFLNLIGIFAYNCITRMLHQNNETVNSSNASAMDENTSQQSEGSLLEEDVLTGLLETSCILWKSLDRRMPTSKLTGKNRELRKKIMITFSRTLHVCLKVANEDRILNAILLLSSYLPPASMPVFSKSVLPKLKSLSDAVPPSHYGMLIECVCAWDWKKQLLELIRDWLVNSIKAMTSSGSSEPQPCDDSEKTNNESTSRRSARLSKLPAEAEHSVEAMIKGGKRKKKKVMFTGVQQEDRPAQALKYLSSFLDIQSRMSFPVLNDPACRELLFCIDASLEKCQDEIVGRLSVTRTKSHPWTNDILVDAIEVHHNLMMVIHLHDREKCEEKSDESDDLSQVVRITVDKLSAVVDWFQVVSGKYEESNQKMHNTSILETKSTTGPLSNLSLYRRVFSVLLEFCIQLLQCGVPLFEGIQGAISNFAGCGVSLIEHASYVTKLLHLLQEERVLKLTNEETTADNKEDMEETRHSNAIIAEQLIFDALLSALLQHSQQNPDSFNQVFRQEVRQFLRSLIKEQFLIHSIFPLHVWYKVLTSKVISAIMADLFKTIRASTSFARRDRISELPTFSAALLPVVMATSAECCHICEETIPTLAQDESMFPPEHREYVIQCFAHLLYTLSKDGKNRDAVNVCIGDLNQVVVGFDHVMTKVRMNQGIDEDQNNKATLTSEIKSLQPLKEPEPIVVLEDLENPPMVMDDEDFVL